jgi:uncharacterized membrane protein YagU involved in acid resistance
MIREQSSLVWKPTIIHYAFSLLFRVELLVIAYIPQSVFEIFDALMQFGFDFFVLAHVVR